MISIFIDTMSILAVYRFVFSVASYTINMIVLPSPFPLHCGMEWFNRIGVPLIMPFLHDIEVVSEANRSHL